MNIYFCGIGGVGLGPLAEIALDAGHSVQGSDPHESLMTKRLSERGVAINSKQKGKFLQAMHEHTPIDWFVYTSGLPADHPELQLAHMLGIKTTKRDELLLHILEEKNLKLIAVAGTHGKTTTTAMGVWALQQLGIPVSYSVGTTMSFGPSGHYEQGSDYFIYECDEFDRNFLQFHPHLSLITSVDYDHPDTYGTPEDYIAAFRQFISQSEHTLLWQNDANMIGEAANSWVLGDHDMADVTLAGLHNRRNASLVVKAIEKLGLTGDAAVALNQFPGVDRRFEKLLPNLYTDYGHHPTEIAATLQLARELSDDVVLVYQPHQNIRQHELRTQYTDCFELASDIYWLPTYLTREDPSLAVLSPEELTENITNYASVHIAELDDELWTAVQKARDRGALVLLMGAGTIDEWARERLAIRQIVNVLVVSSDGSYIMQQRDDKPGISNPGEISAFGGSMESTDESFKKAAARELREETNIPFQDDDLQFFKIFRKTEADGSPSDVTYYILSGVSTEGLEVYEGQGYIKIHPSELGQHHLTILVRSVIAEYANPSPLNATPRS